jgi:hypothetical protein
MTNLNDVADTLNRTVKLALDTGEASSIQEAEQIFAGYRLQIIVGPDVAHNVVLQAALLTAVNCAIRTLLGGVTVIGTSGLLKVRLPPFTDMEQAVIGLGAQLAVTPEFDVPTLVIGDVVNTELEPLAMRLTFAGWCGGVVPAVSNVRLTESGNFTPAGVLAGAIGVSEIFQRLRGGNPYACRRAIGLDLWCPEREWVREMASPALECLPAAAWLIGLGNLGQAYLWTLGLLPYGANAADLVLQDIDVLAPSNLSTSLLTRPDLLGQRKTRAMAVWAEMRGFKTVVVERSFSTNFRVGQHEPSVGLIGVDNALARQAAEEVGFERVIEAGLGRGPQDFLGIDVHTFPAAKLARDIWCDTASSGPDISLPAYRELLNRSKDRCGTIQLAERTIGAPFVGAVAASLVISELVRLALGAGRYEMISCHLRNLDSRIVVKGESWQAFNPGTISLNA